MRENEKKTRIQNGRKTMPFEALTVLRFIKLLCSLTLTSRKHDIEHVKMRQLDSNYLAISGSWHVDNFPRFLFL